ncbi:MAG: hypothetical protein JF571_02600 [Asticcacaulis sp.]|nr:hypothetical protein [Asticcacaulis sp.]
MSARTSTFVKTVAAVAVASAVMLPVAASAHDGYGYDDDDYVVVRPHHHGDRCSGNTAGGVVTGAIVGGAAGAVPGAVVGAVIGGAIGSDTNACHYRGGYAYDDDDDYVYETRGYDRNAYDRSYNSRYSYSRSNYGYRDPYYGNRHRSDW